MKRIVSLVMVLVLCFSLFSFSASAEAEESVVESTVEAFDETFEKPLGESTEEVTEGVAEKIEKECFEEIRDESGRKLVDNDGVIAEGLMSEELGELGDDSLVEAGTDFVMESVDEHDDALNNEPDEEIIGTLGEEPSEEKITEPDVNFTKIEEESFSGSMDGANTYLNWSLETLGGDTITQDTYADKIQLLVFYRAELYDSTALCSNSGNILSSLAESDWISDESVQVIAVSVSGDSEAEEFKEQYAPYCDDIVFAVGGSSLLWSCLNEYGYYSSSVTLAVGVILYDNSVYAVKTGMYKADQCKSLLSSIDDFGDMAEVQFQVKYCQTDSRAMLDGINELRTGSEAWYWNSDNTSKTICSGLSELTYDYQLEKVAMQRCAEIALSYSHTRPNGGDCFSAYDEMSYSYSWAGENIAAGFTTANAAFDVWCEDDCYYEGQGHRRNMLSSEFNRVGIAGCYVNGVYYWVQEFAYNNSSVSATTANDSWTDVLVQSFSSDLTLTLEADNTSVSVLVGCSKTLPTVEALVEGLYYWGRYGIPVTNTVTWNEGNTSIASISNEKVQGRTVGNTYITASVLGEQLTFPVTVLLTWPITSTKIVEGPIDITEELRMAGIQTTEAITQKLSETMLKAYGYSASRLVNYDADLKISEDNGKTWRSATEDDFSNEGLEVLLPYPEGTNADDYDFRVAHMFDKKTKDHKAGDIEILWPEKTEDGLKVRVTSLSPVVIAWKSHTQAGDIDGKNGVNALDLITLVRYLLKYNVTPVANPDVDGNDNVNLSDVIHLLRYITDNSVVLYN